MANLCVTAAPASAVPSKPMVTDSCGGGSTLPPGPPPPPPLQAPSSCVCPACSALPTDMCATFQLTNPPQQSWTFCAELAAMQIPLTLQGCNITAVGSGCNMFAFWSGAKTVIRPPNPGDQWGPNQAGYAATVNVSVTLTSLNSCIGGCVWSVSSGVSITFNSGGVCNFGMGGGTFTRTDCVAPASLIGTELAINGCVGGPCAADTTPRGLTITMGACPP